MSLDSGSSSKASYMKSKRDKVRSDAKINQQSNYQQQFRDTYYTTHNLSKTVKLRTWLKETAKNGRQTWEVKDMATEGDPGSEKLTWHIYDFCLEMLARICNKKSQVHKFQVVK